MCGIVGYIGPQQAYPILIKGLKRLEYRGYDSAGVALMNDNQILNVYKAKGKVSDLELSIEKKDISGTIGIAHTRWATHGEPCQANAHPHYSSSENLALIHNGIIRFIFKHCSVVSAYAEVNDATYVTKGRSAYYMR